MDLDQTPAEKDIESLEKIATWIQKRKREESSKARPMSRAELVAYNNSKMLVVRRRPAQCKPGLTFAAIGSWGC